MAGARIRYIGVAEESIYGTKITDDDCFIYIDGSTVGLDVPSGQALIFEGITQRAPVVSAPGQYIPAGDIAMPLDARVLGFLLKWILGDYYQVEQLDGSEEVYRHTFLPANTLDSFSVRLGRDILSHDFEGCKIASATIDIKKGEFATITFSIVGQQDSKGTLKAMSEITIDRIGYFRFSQAVLALGEVNPVSVENISITINNNVDGADGIRLGSRFPQFLETGKRDIEYSLDISFDSTTQLEAFWGATTEPTDIDSRVFTLTLTGETISGSSNTYKLIIDSAAVITPDSAQNYSGRDRIVQAIKLTPMFDETTDREIRARLITDYEPYSLDTNLHAVFAQSTTKIWAVGTHGEIVYSADGGTTWTAQTSGLTGLDARINAIFMISATVGWAVGDNGVILYTVDAGTTWTAQTSGVTTDLMDVWAYDADKVWVVGKDATIIGTANAGVGWIAETAPESITGDLHAIFGKSDSILVAVGAGGKIAYTADGGATWTTKISGVTTDLLGISEFTNVTDLWLVCGASGVILTSTDADAWSEEDSGVSAHLRACALASLTVGMAVGETGTIIATDDGGGTWSILTPVNAITTLWGISLASATVGWVVGSMEAVWKTTDATAWTAQSL